MKRRDFYSGNFTCLDECMSQEQQPLSPLKSKHFVTFVSIHLITSPIFQGYVVDQDNILNWHEEKKSFVFTLLVSKGLTERLSFFSHKRSLYTLLRNNVGYRYHGQCKDYEV